MRVLIKGTSIFWAGNQRHTLAAGDVIVLPRNLPHADRSPPARQNNPFCAE